MFKVIILIFSVSLFAYSERELKYMTQDELIQIVLLQQTKINKLITLSDSILSDLKLYQKRDKFWFWRSPIFSFEVGFSTMLKQAIMFSGQTYRLFKSIFDAYVGINFYLKWFGFGIAVLPANLQIIGKAFFYF